MNRWNWLANCGDDQRRGTQWLGALSASAPFLTVLLLALMMFVVDGKLTLASGVAFDLPSGDMSEAAHSSTVIMLMPNGSETIAFFDDARYTIDDVASVSSLASQLSRRLEGSGDKTVLVLADRRVSGGALMRMAEIVGKSGASKVLFAERHSEESVE